jgi:hypothetical protein
MTVTTEVPMIQRHTPNFIICDVCKISNNFLIQVVEQKGTYYYMEKCPRERCGHVFEFKEINGREAKRYIDVPAEDPFAQ